MKKYLWLILVATAFGLSYKTMADEVTQKTDGSFVGDDSKSVDNDSFVGENLQKQTDSEFVGANTVQSGNLYFAGDKSDKEEHTETDAPFAEDNSKKVKDGIFIGEDLQNKTDSPFDGDSYGK
jgi:hypothetical protein